jgi:hypothetical protein
MNIDTLHFARILTLSVGLLANISPRTDAL